MDREFKAYIEQEFDYLVKLYNRYIRRFLKDVSPLEYYASPYMNLVGYPSENFLYFCAQSYNKKYQKNIRYKPSSIKIFRSLYHYVKLLFLFTFSSLFFSKKVDSNSVIIHAFHDDENFHLSPYRTIKSPPLETFTNHKVYHDINISFISLKSLFHYKKHNILCSLSYLSFRELMKLHYLAARVYFKSKTLQGYGVSYVEILFTLVKGVSIASLINQTDTSSIYFNMWENRGYHHILDFLVKDNKKLYHLDLGVLFRLSPEYMMLHHLRHTPRGYFLIMSHFNYDLVYKRMGSIEYDFFKNYRINCHTRDVKNVKNNILLLSPLSSGVAKRLYTLLLSYDKGNIKLKLHPYLERTSFNEEYLETRALYDILDDYDTVVYTGATTAAIELYFQGMKVYKFITSEFLDSDPLVDNALVETIDSLEAIGESTHTFTQDEKNYYLGCDNKTLQEILQGMRK